MANTIIFLHLGFPWVPIDFKVDLFYAPSNNYRGCLGLESEIKELEDQEIKNQSSFSC